MLRSGLQRRGLQPWQQGGSALSLHARQLQVLMDYCLALVVWMSLPQGDHRARLDGSAVWMWHAVVAMKLAVELALLTGSMNIYQTMCAMGRGAAWWVWREQGPEGKLGQTTFAVDFDPMQFVISPTYQPHIRPPRIGIETAPTCASVVVARQPISCL